MSDETEYEMSSDDFCLKLLSSRLSRYEWEINRIVAMLKSEKLTDSQKINATIRMASAIESKS